tara:strand:+ start:204 stop:563 length:360 start_codon:yes stop_codon:yes gene_type:complete
MECPYLREQEDQMRRRIDQNVLVTSPPQRKKPLRKSDGSLEWEELRRFWASKAFAPVCTQLLSDFCGVSRSTVQCWLRGRIPREEYIPRIAIYLGSPFHRASDVEEALRRIIRDRRRIK